VSLPKAELHVHLEGTATPALVRRLAARHGTQVPPGTIEDDRFGSSFRLTRVRDPLVLLPTLPRILSFDETLQVPVTVRNDTGKPGSIQVGLTAQGPVQIEKPAQAVEIPVGREKTVYFTVKTGNAEANVRFTATAAGNGEQSKSTTEVSIRPDLPEVSVENAGAVSGAAVEVAAKDLETYRPETVRRGEPGVWAPIRVWTSVTRARRPSMATPTHVPETASA